MGSSGMVVGISGASGFVGSRLGEYLTEEGHKVIAIDRELFEHSKEHQLLHTIARCNAIINLAGAPINHRWSKNYKKELYDSRIETTKQLVRAVNSLENISTFISTSAVGYYPSIGCHSEDSGVKGTGFLSDLCMAWEEEAQKVSPSTRLIITRFGVVLAPHGGAFEKLVQSTKFGISTILGNGTQPFSWIDREDLVRALAFLLEDESLCGVFNITAPQMLTNGEATKIVAQHYKTSLTIHVPALLLKIIFGESSQFILQGQCARPEKLANAGFDFITPDFDRFISKL